MWNSYIPNDYGVQLPRERVSVVLMSSTEGV